MRLSRIKLSAVLSLVSAFLANGSFALSLSEAHSDLIKNDPDILRSEVGTMIAKTRQERAVSELSPKISVTLATSRTSREQYGAEERYRGEEYSLIASQSMFNKPLSIEPDRLNAIVKQREAAAKGELQKRRFELVSFYAQWLEGNVRQQLLQRRLEAVGKRYDQAKSLFGKQRLSVTQVLIVENERDRVKAELARAQALAVTAQSSLESLIGYEIETSINRASLVIKEWPLDAEILTAVDSRDESHPLIDQAVSQRAAARLSLKQAEGQRMPRIDATLELRRTNIGASESETFPVESSSAQITMTWDLYDSGERDLTIREAQLSIRDADLAFRQAQRDVERLQRSASLDIQRYREAWNAAYAEYQSAEKLLTAADRGFELGVGTVGDSLVAIERLIEAESRLTSRWLESLLGVAQIGQVNNRLTSEVIDSLSDRFIK